MKNTVVEIINCDCPQVDKFNKLFALYNAHPRRNKATAFRLNADGFNQRGLDLLVYELRKLENVSDLEVHIAAKAEKKPCRDCSNKREPIQPKLEEKKVVEEKKAPEDKKEKFREEYPFLNDPDVPKEFKILAADKITSYNKIKEGQEKLSAAIEGNSDLTEEELAVIAQEVAANDELNALIHEELTHYQEKGEILGKHPIFVEWKLQEKVDKMTGEEKLKRFNTLGKDISREKTNLEKAEKAAELEKAEKIKARLVVKEAELNLLRKLTQ